MLNLQEEPQIIVTKTLTNYSYLRAMESFRDTSPLVRMVNCAICGTQNTSTVHTPESICKKCGTSLYIGDLLAGVLLNEFGQIAAFVYVPLDLERFEIK